MASSPPCKSCGTNVNDFTGATQIFQINRMIGDNYMVIVFSVIVLVVVGFLMYFAINQIINVLKVYKRANADADGIAAKKTQDAEVYDDEQLVNDPTIYFPAGKAEFVEKMDKAYKEYNTLKTDYILSSYSRTNDDLVDTSTLYRKHDNYEYAKKDDT